MSARVRVLLAITGVLAGVAFPATAATAQGAGSRCQGRIGSDLGFRSFDVNGSVFVENGFLNFGAEPRLSGIDPDGPAAGRLRQGDVLVAVDGRLITTRAASLRLWQAQPGETVNLTVRRDGRRVVVPIIVGAACAPASAAVLAPLAPAPPGAPALPALAPAAIPAPPAPPALPALPAPAPAPSARPLPVPAVPAAPPAPPAPAGAPALPALPAPPAPPVPPRGVLGIGLSCGPCSMKDEGKGRVSWTFGSPPTVTAVEPGTAAERAGLRAGDRIERIDGIAITSPAGGRRFGAIAPGQKVRLGVRRGSTPVEVVLTAEEP